jgi:1,4-alpha-glucan branching enzyme
MAEKSAKAKAPGKSATTKTAGKVATPKVAAKPSAAKAGAKQVKKKTTFKLRAPDATQVFVAGCFNRWNPAADPLRPGNDGTWTCALMLEPGEHEYRFVVDGVWCNDPMAQMRRPNDVGCENCIIVV